MNGLGTYDCLAALRTHLRFKVMNLKSAQMLECVCALTCTHVFPSNVQMHRYRVGVRFNKDYKFCQVSIKKQEGHGSWGYMQKSLYND